MKNFETLIKEHFGQLSNREVAFIRPYFQEEKLQKNEFFTQTDNKFEDSNMNWLFLATIFQCLHGGKQGFIT